MFWLSLVIISLFGPPAGGGHPSKTGYDPGLPPVIQGSGTSVPVSFTGPA